MSTDALITLIILVGAVVLLVSEWLPVDLVAMLVLACLGVTGVLAVPDLLTGLGHPVTLAIIGIFMLSAALTHTGLTTLLGRWLVKRAGECGESALVAMIALAAALFSLTMNTMAATALVVPVAAVMARSCKTSPSRLLMPVSYGALLGGMATLLTSVNLIIAGLLTDHALPSFGLLDFFPVGGPIALLGIAYLAVFGQRLLPERVPVDWAAEQISDEELRELYDIEARLHHATILPRSPLAGRTLAESDLRQSEDVNVVGIIRSGKKLLSPPATMELEVGDDLLITGRFERVEAAAMDLRLDLADEHLNSDALAAGDVALAEVALSPHTTLIDQTLREVNFREKFGLTVLAIWREGRSYRSRLAERPLRFGDALLVQGPADRIALLRRERDFLVLVEPDQPVQVARAVTALAILLAFLLVIAIGRLPVALAALLGAVLAIVTGCLSMDQARNSVEWRAVFLVAGMLPLATALDRTGAAQILASSITGTIGALGPLALLAGFFLLAVGLAQMTSGIATALLIGPIALNAALASNLNPRSLMMAVAIACSSAFLSPVAHPANLLVMGPGGYRFRDYARVGLPLVGLALLVVLILLPRVWPLGV